MCGTWTSHTMYSWDTGGRPSSTGSRSVSPGGRSVSPGGRSISTGCRSHSYRRERVTNWATPNRHHYPAVTGIHDRVKTWTRHIDRPSVKTTVTDTFTFNIDIFIMDDFLIVGYSFTRFWFCACVKHCTTTPDRGARC